jgi:hypothetical protein
MERTKAMSCSTTTMVWLPLSPINRLAVRAISPEVMPATGSSTSNTLARWASSMPNSSHCFWPWASVPA